MNYLIPELTLKKDLVVLPDTKITHLVESIEDVHDWGLLLQDIPGVWHVTKGAGVKIAILDSGVDLEHPDLKMNIKEAKDFTSSITGPYDTDGHGTHLAGVIGASSTKGGIVGLSPEAELYIAKVIDKGYGKVDNIMNAIDWAIENDVQLICMSFTMPEYNEKLHKKIIEAYNNNIFVICASGDGGPFLDVLGYPGNYDEVIAAGSVNNEPSSIKYLSKGTLLDIITSSENVLSTSLNSSYAYMNGTTVSSAFVTGVVALLLAYIRDYPQLSSGQVVNNDQLRIYLKHACVRTDKLRATFAYSLIDPFELLNH